MNSSASSPDPRSTAVNSSPVETSVRSAMSAARLAQNRWTATPLAERLAHIRELRRLIADHAMLLAEASASARNRPPLESLTAEVLPIAEACRFLEREAGSILAPRRHGSSGLPLWLSGVRSEVRREPFGVVLVIGPGNYPLLLPGVQIIHALVAGNAVLLKPGVGGTAAAHTLIDLIHRSGIDPHLVALLPESTEAARAAIEALPDKVIFTGSAATGEKILAQLAPHLIPSVMELSGCDAVIVRGDADLDLVVKALKFGVSLNNGATCMAPKRVFVHRAIGAELESRLARLFRPGAPVSEPASFAVRAEYETGAPLPHLLSEAVAQGAHFIAGGISPDGKVRLPAILAGVVPSSRLLTQDVFAPVLSLVTVADDAEAIACANNCPFALGASVFTRDESAGRAIAASLNVGIVSLNDLIIPSADARLPFGGRKRSGFGVTRGPEGLLELTTPKIVTISRAKFRPALEPPHPKDEAMFKAYLELTHGRGFGRSLRALFALFKSLSGRSKLNTNPFP